MSDPQRIGDFLPSIIRKAKPSKKALAGKTLAQKILSEYLPQYQNHIYVYSMKAGVATLASDSAALFQEVEGFHKEKLLELLRAQNLKVHTVRVKLKEAIK